MGFINKYPYVDFHELNADALIAKVDDASAEAKAAADTVATYNDRLTTVEGDLAPIKSAMPGIASDISDLQHDTGIIDSLITNTINPAIDTLKNEVETPTTGLLDRVTALENQPSTGGITEYLRFGTGGTPIDYDARITYTYLDDKIAMTASADKTVNIVLVEDDELGTTWYYTLNEGEYQISAGTPRGQFTFVCRKPVLDGNNVVTGYKVCTVTVNKNAATPTYTEVYEAILPTVTSADAGDVLTVDNNGDWVADTPYLPNAFDVLWNSTGATVGSMTGNVSTPSTTLSIALSGQMNFTVTFKGILEITAQTGSVCYAKYMLYKRAGNTTVCISKLYELGGVLSDVALSLTGGSNPGSPATALNVAMTVTSGMNAIVKLYSV